MATEIKYNNVWIKRDGNRILFDHYWRDNYPFNPDVAVILNDDGSIELDQEWVLLAEAKEKRLGTWRQLLSDMGFTGPIYDRLQHEPPPAFVLTREQMLSYLEAIANKEIKVDGLAKRGIELVTQGIARFKAQKPPDDN